MSFWQLATISYSVEMYDYARFEKLRLVLALPCQRPSLLVGRLDGRNILHSCLFTLPYFIVTGAKLVADEIKIGIRPDFPSLYSQHTWQYFCKYGIITYQVPDACPLLRIEITLSQQHQSNEVGGMEDRALLAEDEE